MSVDLKQQEAAVAMLRVLVGSGRARRERLEAAEDELRRLQGVSREPRQRAASAYVQHIEADVKVAGAYEKRQADLSQQAGQLRKEQAELSNMLHKVPIEQYCEELTSRILDLQERIEVIWDEKKLLERQRNGEPLPMVAVGEAGSFEVKAAPRKLEDVAEKAVLTVELQRLREKQSKLRKKLEDLGAKPSKRVEWETELAGITSQIEEMVAKRNQI